MTTYYESEAHACPSICRENVKKIYEEDLLDDAIVMTFLEDLLFCLEEEDRMNDLLVQEAGGR